MSQLLILSSTESEALRDLHAILEGHGPWQVRCVVKGEELPRILETHTPSLILGCLPSRDGPRIVESLSRVLSQLGLSVPLLPVIPEETLEKDLPRLGDAGDFLVAPLRPVEVRARIRQILDRQKAERLSETSAQMTLRLGLEAVVGEDPVFAAIKAKLPLIARAEATVLISGETGTGKEVIGRAIHYLSRRIHRPFLPVNCGAIPTELFENELFGHMRGAFTDARSSVAGLIADAEGGTLFLDEVDAIPLVAQVKLLHFLQHKAYRPLGSASFRRAEVRIIAATNADLEAKVKTGAFREDLYYRLNIIPVALPPLRERREDIPLLAKHFLDKYTTPESRGAWQVARGFLECLQRYAWPGNIRELENLIQQIVALRPPGELGRDALPSRFLAQAVSIPPATFREAKGQAVASFEREYTTRLLFAHRGNVTRAAREAGKDRRAFGRLVKKYGLGIS